MTTPPMQVILTTSGSGGRLNVGGVDITNATRSATINVDTHGTPRVTVELAVLDTAADLSAAHVAIGPHTTAVLQRLGWTPPSTVRGTEDQP